MSENNLHGLAELQVKLGKMNSDISKKTLRSAALLSTTQVVKKMKQAAPMGSRWHRTYRGNLVSPGFLRRSIRRRTRAGYGWATVTIGVLQEAYYGVVHVERGTRKMRARPWFIKSFTDNRHAIEKRFVEQLRMKIEKIARS